MKKLLLHKNKGNVTSLILGQMWLILLIAFCMFTFKSFMIEACINFLDDTITDSLLSAALVNVSEYGRSSQLVIYDNDEYEAVTGGWTDYEKAILLSELNYNSSIIVNSSALETKKKIFEGPNGRHNADWKTDATKMASINKFLGTFTYNVSNGNNGNTGTVHNNLGTLSAADGGDMNVPETVLDKYILGTYIKDASDNYAHVNGTHAMDITRFDEYDIYRAELAQRRVYKSDFFELKCSDDTSTYKETYPTVSLTWTVSVPASEVREVCPDYSGGDILVNSLAKLDKAYCPDEDQMDDIDDYYVKYNKWQKLRKKFLADVGSQGGAGYSWLDTPSTGYGTSYFGYLEHSKGSSAIGASGTVNLGVVNRGLSGTQANYPLFCYFNTHTTFIDCFNPKRVKYGFFFNAANTATDSPRSYESDNFNVESTYTARALQLGDVAPIVGYSVYSYKSPYSEQGYSQGCNYVYHGKSDVLDSSGKIKVDSAHSIEKELKATDGVTTTNVTRYVNYIPIENGKMAGHKLYNTSLYTEVTFNMSTFVTMPGSSINFVEAPVQRVTMARLVDIDLDID